jgi:putative membrane protein
MMGTSTMVWMWIWPVLVVGGLLVLGYVALRLAQSSQRASPTRADPGLGSSARWILDERYARGEIDDEEYRRRKDELS